MHAHTHMHTCVGKHAAYQVYLMLYMCFGMST